MRKTSKETERRFSLIQSPRIVTKSHIAWVEIEENFYPVMEMSTHGLLFQNGLLAEEDWSFARIIIPSLEQTISAVIEIIHVAKNRDTICRFKTLLTRDKKLIHDYMEALNTAEAG